MAAFNDDYDGGRVSTFKKYTPAPNLEDGAHLACITAFEWKELSDGKGHAVVLTFSVLNPNENYRHNIPCYFNIAHKTSEPAVSMAKKLSKELRMALDIQESIFDLDIGISHENLKKHLQWRTVIIHIEGKQQEYTDSKTKEKKVRMGYNIKSFAPAKFHEPTASVRPDPGKVAPLKTVPNGIYKPQNEDAIPEFALEDESLNDLIPY